MPTDVFDDDEESKPVYFEHDPDEEDLNVGYWTRKDGSRVYGPGDMQDVKDLHAQGKAKLDEAGSALALAGGAAQASPGEPEAPELPKSTPLTPEERAPLEASPGEVQALGGSEPAPAATPQPAPAPPSAPEAPETPKPLTAPGLPGPARGPARFTDTANASQQQSQSVNAQNSVSRTGSAQSEAEFKQQQADIDKGYQGQIAAADQGAQSVVDAQQDRKRALMQMAVDRETATAAAQASAETRKQQVIKKYQEVDSRKTDMNGLWKDKGALGTTLGLLGVALRSLNSTKFGGPNTALQSIQEQKRQNIQAQMEDRSSELRGLERELGSIEAAAPMLEARMNDALIKRLDAMTIDEKSATVLANARTMKAQLQTESAAKKAESAKAYYGTLATQQSLAQQQSQTQGQELGQSRLSGAGVGDKAKGKTREQLFDDLLERDKKMEERGYPKGDRDKMWEAYGLHSPSSESEPTRTNREQSEKTAREEANFNEDQAKAESAMTMLEEHAKDAGLKRDPKTGKWVEPGGLDGTVVPGWSEGVTELAGQSTPIRDSRELATEAFGRLASGGVISKDEGERFGQFFGEGKATRNQMASKLNALETLVNTRRKANRRDQTRAVPDSWRKKPGEAQP